MKRRFLAVLLSLLLILSQSSLVDAKGASRSSGSSKSYSGSSKSSSSYKSSPSSSSSARSSTSSGSSSSGYSGSSTSKSATTSGGTSAGSASTSKSTTPTSGSKPTKSDTLKSSYMQDEYKKQVSSNNYSSFKQSQNLNDSQKKAYDSSFNKSYTSSSRMDFDNAMRTRPQRVSNYSTRPIIMNVNNSLFGSPFSYGYGFVGPWDLWFLMRASDMFWYHHWTDISPHSNYFDAKQFAQMEQRVKTLEAQNVARDPAYMEKDVDPDLQLTSDYLQKNTDKYYTTNKYSKSTTNPVAIFFTIVIIAGVLIVVIRLVSKRKPSRPYKSGGIY